MKTILIVMLLSSICFGGLIEGTNIDWCPILLFGLYSEMGWVYTTQSSTSYYLESIQTMFSNTLGWIIDPSIPYYDVEAEGWNRTVVLEIYTVAPSEGGQLLRTAAFTPAPDTLVGGSFEPLLVNPGDALFIGLRNIQGLGMNTTISGPDWLVTYINTSIPSTGSYETQWPNTSSPILFFYGDPVPEPASLMLLTLGGMLMRKRCSE